MSTASNYLERTYAGVLGKIIGVYLGRPVEGWPFGEITERFGEIRHYINDQLNIPIVTADDDISGSFGFSRSVVDHAGRGPLTAGQVGETWLNYIIEDRTILWWGGRGRSTEHTAYLNLARGMKAPDSGSFDANGKTLPVQVGAQIFVDAFAMMSPGDPLRAGAMARTAASVSHDGAAVEAAGFIAAMQALAYTETRLELLLDVSSEELGDPVLLRILHDVRTWCDATDEWREVRERIDTKYGYERFAGPCPVTTNFAAVVASVLLGGDSFRRALSVAASAGWDTDSNAGVVGAFNGIRLGLEGLDEEADLRTPIGDRLFVVTADGGECITDAVRETYAIDAGRRVLDGEPSAARSARFSFGMPGSTQGFERCSAECSPYVGVEVMNTRALDGSASEAGLRIAVRGTSPAASAAVSTPTFLPRPGDGDNFSTLASPTLYPGQLLRAKVRLEHPIPDHVEARLYVVAETADGQLKATASEPVVLDSSLRDLTWTVPEVGPNPILRVGIRVCSVRRFDGSVILAELDWCGAPEYYHQRGVLLSSIWDLHPEAMRQWVSSAKNHEADFRYTHSVSHPDGTGVVTVGTRDWDDYTVSATLAFNPHERGGVVARARGHRRWYAAVLESWNTLVLVRADHEEETVLASATFPYVEDVPVNVALTCSGSMLSVAIDGERALFVEDDSDDALRSGGAGFVVTSGTLLADDFTVRAERGDK